MAVNTISAPTLTLKSPSSWGSRSAIKNQMSKIWSNYGKYIQFASKESGIDPKILTAFIAIESGGNPTAGAGNTKNLMQANVSYMKTQLENEFKAGRLSEAEKSKLLAYGIKFDANGKTREITVADNFKPELNILIGSIILGQLASQPWATDSTGALKLASIITIYNTGMYSPSAKKAIAITSANPKALYDALIGNNTTRAYLSKAFGVDGALDIASNELKDIIVA
jgi:soluble lytic murein transglycosylase-like protein